MAKNDEEPRHSATLWLVRPVLMQNKSVLTFHGWLVAENRWVGQQRDAAGGHGLIVAPAVPPHAGWGKAKGGVVQSLDPILSRKPVDDAEFELETGSTGLKLRQQAIPQRFVVGIGAIAEENIPFPIMTRNGGKILGFGQSQADGMELVPKKVWIGLLRKSCPTSAETRRIPEA